jgi:hypothetical protein
MNRHLSQADMDALRAVPITPDRQNRLKFAMTLVDVTAKDIAAVTGLHEVTICSLVNGEAMNTRPTTKNLIAAFFGCSKEDLFPTQDVPAQVAS